MGKRESARRDLKSDIKARCEQNLDEQLCTPALLSKLKGTMTTEQLRTVRDKLHSADLRRRAALYSREYAQAQKQMQNEDPTYVPPGKHCTDRWCGGDR